MQLDEGKFPNQWRLYCMFCDNPEPHFEPYLHGHVEDTIWTCPRCGTTYRFGRAMYFDVSGPFLKIRMPKSNQELEFPMQYYNAKTGFVEPKRGK
jgi:RNase P subunit RPR2